ncbi:hypothetical protein HYH02_001333 [Chlamydomonas schloesseri]|uniref:Uncharacterized protein n=1 Tax=Chlamydomonas schloesseri TaxID=2026947 RepID=A0A835WU51_9CHLO|nr:hypothetical protein HYH02_001333 [Chlamydomonas schloesseri]|eukprot:KAG2454304.1 hypothetical protein HYH02_001333 [Chlamydomonas schloesseri]
MAVVDVRRRLADTAATGTCPTTGAGSLSLLVLLSVPAAAANNSQQFKSQIASALDAWTSESASGSGAAGMLQLCGPALDEIITTTTVRVMTEVPLSSSGASNLSSVCGSADLTATTALGGAGSAVACRVTTASTAGDVRPPAVSDPRPAPVPAPVSAAGASTSYLPIIIAAAVTGGVVGAVCLAVIGIVARRRTRDKRQREAADPGDPSSSESDHGLPHASSRQRVAAGLADTETNQFYVGAEAAGPAASGGSAVEAGGILAVVLPTAATRGGSGNQPVAGTAGVAAASAAVGGGNALSRRTAEMTAAEESELRAAFHNALQSAVPPLAPRSDDCSVQGRHAARTASAIVPPAVSAPPGGAAAWSGPNGSMTSDRAPMLPWEGSNTGSGYVSASAAAAAAAGPRAAGTAPGAGGSAAAMRASLDGRVSSPGISGRSVRVSRRVQPMGSSSLAVLMSRGTSSAVSDARISSGDLPPAELLGPQDPKAYRGSTSTSGAAVAAAPAAAAANSLSAFMRQSLHTNLAFEPNWRARAKAGGAGVMSNTDGGGAPVSASIIVARAAATAGGGATVAAGSAAGSDVTSLFERFKSQFTGGLSAGGGRHAGSVDGSPGGSPRVGSRGLSLRNITAIFKEGGGSSAGSARPSLDGAVAAVAATGSAAGTGLAAAGATGSPFIREDVPDIEGAPPLETRGSGGSGSGAVVRHAMSDAPLRARGSLVGRSSLLRPVLASPLGPGGSTGGGGACMSVPQAQASGSALRRFNVLPAAGGASTIGGAHASSASPSRVRFSAAIPEGSPEHFPSAGGDIAVTGLPPPPRAPTAAGPSSGAPAPVLASSLAPPLVFAMAPRPYKQLRKAKTQTASPSLREDELLGDLDEDEMGVGLPQRQQADLSAAGLAGISAARLRVSSASTGQRSSDNGMLSSAPGAPVHASALLGIGPMARRAMMPSGSKSASVLGGRRATHSGVPEGASTGAPRSARPPSLLSPEAAAARAQPPAAAKKPVREAFAAASDGGAPGSLG